VASHSSRRRHPAAAHRDRTGVANRHETKGAVERDQGSQQKLASRQNGSGPERDRGAIIVRVWRKGV